jgi:hypothetical protein
MSSQLALQVGSLESIKRKQGTPLDNTPLQSVSIGDTFTKTRHNFGCLQKHGGTIRLVLSTSKPRLSLDLRK